MSTIASLRRGRWLQQAVHTVQEAVQGKRLGKYLEAAWNCVAVQRPSHERKNLEIGMNARKRDCRIDASGCRNINDQQLCAQGLQLRGKVLGLLNLNASVASAFEQPAKQIADGEVIFENQNRPR